MNETNIYNLFTKAAKEKRKSFAVLVDPDKVELSSLDKIIALSGKCRLDYFLVGGSLLTSPNFEKCIEYFSKNTGIPLIIFPGSHRQISKKADAILFLSLISGRNPDFLIGQHVLAAPALKASKIETISTAYILIDGGKPTTASYISNTTPIPADKPEIAVCTAMAGEMLGMKLIYLDAGSGAKNAISKTVISAVKQNVSVPLVVGGGIKSPEQAETSAKAGADVIVVGNAIEKDIMLLSEISYAVHSSKIPS